MGYCTDEQGTQTRLVAVEMDGLEIDSEDYPGFAEEFNVGYWHNIGIINFPKTWWYTYTL